MADKKLESIVKIDNEDYAVVAEIAKRLENSLTIKVANGTTDEYTFDGSAAKSIEINAIQDATHAESADFATNAGSADFATNADIANKVKGILTINVIRDGKTIPVTFDGSENSTIDVGDAKKIQVTTDDGNKSASITISKDEPEAGNVGDIWFKYS